MNGHTRSLLLRLFAVGFAAAMLTSAVSPIPAVGGQTEEGTLATDDQSVAAVGEAHEPSTARGVKATSGGVTDVTASVEDPQCKDTNSRIPIRQNGDGAESDAKVSGYQTSWPFSFPEDTTEADVRQVGTIAADTYVGTVGSSEVDRLDFLYGNGDPATSYFALEVDGTVYSVAPVAGTERLEPYSDFADSRRAQWTLPEGLVVRQTVSTSGRFSTVASDCGLVRFKLTVNNTGGDDHDVRVRYLLDHETGFEDGPVVRTGGEEFATERAFDDPTFESWETPNDPVDPTLVARTVPVGQPERVVFTRWRPAFESAFDYEPTPGAAFHNRTARDDTASLVYYDLGTVTPGELASAAVDHGYGSGEIERSRPRVSVGDSATNGTDVIADNLPLGDYVVVTDADGAVLGTLGPSTDGLVGGGNTRIPIDDPLTETTEVTVTVYEDTDGDGEVDVESGEDEPVTVDGQPATDTATVVVGTADLVEVGSDPYSFGGTSFTLGEVTLSEGGFVALHGGSDELGSLSFERLPYTRVVGVSGYLPPGTHEDVEIVVQGRKLAVERGAGPLALNPTQALAVPHADSDGDQRFDFRSSRGVTDPVYGQDGAYENFLDIGRQYTERPVTLKTGIVYRPQETYYQVDLIGGDEPLNRLGPSQFGDGAPSFYADEDVDLLLRYAHGTTTEGITQRGTAFPNDRLRTCVDTGSFTRDGETATVEVTIVDGPDCESVTLTLVTYEKQGPGFDRTMRQRRLQSVGEVYVTTETLGPGNHTISVRVPTEDGGGGFGEFRYSFQQTWAEKIQED
jgi:hypothetical protein